MILRILFKFTCLFYFQKEIIILKPNGYLLDIIKAQGEEIVLYNGNNDLGINENKYLGYTCNLKAKYYEKSIILLPVNESIENIKLDIQDNVEAIITYFDSKNKKCIEQIRKYSDYMARHNIENGLILLDNDPVSEDGTSCSDIKNATSLLFNFIDLSKTSSHEDEDLEINYGYEGVIRTLCNLEWLNMKVSDQSEAASVGGQTQQNGCDTEVDGFENLLMKIQAFKSVSMTLQREEVLNHAEQMATQFIKLMNSDVDDDI